MNLVNKYRKISTAKELQNKFSFSVEPFPERNDIYCIKYARDRVGDSERFYLDTDFVAHIMRRALQSKVEHQDRLVFKTSYEVVYHGFQKVIVFNSEKKAKIALRNFMLYIQRHHGSLAHSVLRQTIRYIAPF